MEGGRQDQRRGGWRKRGETPHVGARVCLGVGSVGEGAARGGLQEEDEQRLLQLKNEVAVGVDVGSEDDDTMAGGSGGGGEERSSLELFLSLVVCGLCEQFCLLELSSVVWP